MSITTGNAGINQGVEEPMSPGEKADEKEFIVAYGVFLAILVPFCAALAASPHPLALLYSAFPWLPLLIESLAAAFGVGG